MVEVASQAIEMWLIRERDYSRDSHNAVLDDYPLARCQFAGPFEAAAREGNKVAGHYDRLRILARSINSIDDLHDSRVPARAFLFALMYASGGFRNQCFLQADSQASYETMRFGWPRPIDIDIEMAVDRAAHIRPKTAEALASFTLAANDTMLDLTRGIHGWFADNPDRSDDVLAREDQPVQAMLRRQEIAVGLATSHVLLAADVWGDIEAVPILEPKSITYAAEITVGKLLQSD